jgi:hypothetical protein
MGDVSICPLSAISDRTQRSKIRAYSITSSAAGEQRRRHFDAERLCGLELIANSYLVRGRWAAHSTIAAAQTGQD